MSLCKNRTAQAVGDCKKTLPFCASLEQKIENFNSLMALLQAAPPHTPIYYLGGTVRDTGKRVLLSAKDLIPVIQKRIDFIHHHQSQTEAA